MLTIQTTENLTGVRISGDYWDLDSLLVSIYEVIGDEKRYYDFQGARSRILRVCLELRNAIRGERNIEFVTNRMHKGIKQDKQMLAPDRNVYFSVEILLPEIIFSAIALNDFILLHQETLDDSDWNVHVATIRQFQALISESIKHLIPEEQFLVFLVMLHTKKRAYFRYATQYVDVLNLEYLKIPIEERKNALPIFALRLLSEDDRYKALKDELLGVTNVTKKELHELELTIKYPEEIEW